MPHTNCSNRVYALTRRQMLRGVSAGFGYLAFAGLAQQAQARDSNPLAVKAPHFEPRAKRVLFLYMSGGPSHVDTFDYKPQLQADHGKTMAVGRDGRPGRYGRLLGSPFAFQQRGESGLWISDLFPEVSSMSDELCLLRGMHTDQPAHPQATLALHTGTSRFTRPSLGAWTLYGLGSENENLPGYVALSPGRARTITAAPFYRPSIKERPSAAVAGRRVRGAVLSRRCPTSPTLAIPQSNNDRSWTTLNV